MQNESDVQLLRDYADHGHEAAFRELVTRHTDLVYATALRQVRSPDIAADIAQSVFTDLARKARQVLKPEGRGNSLVGWLHRSTRYAVLNYWRDTRRRLAHERHAMEQLLTNSESDLVWEHICPLLDEALESLQDEDREALLLRYCKRQDLRTVGLTLGISDDAAQKRVSRAVGRLRDFFAQRGVAAGPGAVAAALAAKAGQAAPSGLASGLATAALKAAIAPNLTNLAITKVICMSTIQKALVLAIASGLAGAGLYQAHQARGLRSELQTLQGQQDVLVAQSRQWAADWEDATNRLALLVQENGLFRGKLMQLVSLQARLDRLTRLGFNPNTGEEAEAIESEALSWMGKVEKLKAWLAKTPEQDIPELRLLSNIDWLNAAKDMNLVTTDSIREALGKLRKAAKEHLGQPFGSALRAFARANNDQSPSDILELQSYLQSPVMLEALDRYQMVQSGPLVWDKPAIAEKALADDQYDRLFKFGVAAFWWQGGGESGSSTVDTNEPSPQVVAAAKAASQATPAPADPIDQLMASPEARPLIEADKLYQALHDGKELDDLSADPELLGLLRSRTPHERAGVVEVLKRLLATAGNSMDPEERARVQSLLRALEP